MKVRSLHPWTMTPKEAVALQRRLAPRVSQRSALAKDYRLVAGADVSCARHGKRLYAGVVVCDRRSWQVVESAAVVIDALFPYIPGLLSFREAPGLLEAFARLACRPDVVLVDGSGLIHPRRFGLACHLGVLVDLPTIGVAKSRLVGTHRPPGARRGSAPRLTDKGETIGRVVRTRDGVKPLFVSVGHRIRLDDAVRVVLACSPRYRLPEPIRLAHQFVGDLRIRERPAAG